MRMALAPEIGMAVERAVRLVTGEWRKYKQRQRRDQQVHGKVLEDFHRKMARGNKARLRELIVQMIPAAYGKASGRVNLAKARQVYYVARDMVLAAMEAEGVTGQFVKAKTFTTSILPKYVANNPAETQGWDIIYDARGRITEPHTRRNVPLGTKAVREYLSAFTSGIPTAADPFGVPDRLPTTGPVNRFAAVLFCEKEGFDEIIEASGITRRYDVALMSTKGMSVTAARSWWRNCPTSGQDPRSARLRQKRMVNRPHFAFRYEAVSIPGSAQCHRHRPPAGRHPKAPARVGAGDL